MKARQFLVRALLLLFAWFTILYSVKYLLVLTSLLLKMGKEIIAVMGEAFK